MVPVDGVARADSPRDIRDCPKPVERESPKPFFVMDWLEQIDPRDLERAQKMLQKSKPGHVVDADSVRRVLFEEHTSAIHSASTFHKRSIDIGNGWNAKGLRKAKKDDWKGALECWENALEVRSQVLGEHHLDVANTHNNIGIALGRLNRSTDALEHLDHALNIRIDHYGREHALVAATLHNIANVYHQSGDLESAIQVFIDTKGLLESVGATLEVARTCISMGNIYFEASAFEDAQLAYWDALNIFERARVPKENPEVEALLISVNEIDAMLNPDRD